MINAPQSLLAVLAKLENRDQRGQYDAKRQFKRFPVRADAELVDVDTRGMSREPIAVMLRDVSRGGMGLVTQQKLDVGSIWRLDLLRDHFVIGQQSIIIRHCSQVGAGVYLAGAQVVVDSGLMTLMGVGASVIRDGETTANDDQNQFLAPGEVA